jgi:hypothetical protein
MTLVLPLWLYFATICRLPTSARAICAFGTGLYVRCSKLLWRTAFSTGLYVLVEGPLSGFYVRFVGSLGALSIYPVCLGKEPVLGPSTLVNLCKRANRAP